MKLKVMLVYGTRPEAIKMAPLIQRMFESEDLLPFIVVTGQHREMLDQVNSLFGIVPDVDLDLMSHGSSVTSIARRVLEEMEGLLAKERPDVVVVQGDTTSAFAASLAAFFAEIPVVHLEAGLRTGDLSSPFPEEANRRLTAVVTKLHLAPTRAARANLEREGVDTKSIAVTGNTVVDALKWTVGRDVKYTDERLEHLNFRRRMVLVTTHRRESWGAPMATAMAGLRMVALENPDLQFVLPLHRNRVVREVVVKALGDLESVLLTEPLSYSEFAHLMKQSYLIVTDSGGVQEEAPSLGKPVLVMRETTERPEGVQAGTVRLVGTEADAIRKEIDRLVNDSDAYEAMANSVNPYGDGFAAERAIQAIRARFLGGDYPQAFDPANGKDVWPGDGR